MRLEKLNAKPNIAPRGKYERLLYEFDRLNIRWAQIVMEPEDLNIQNRPERIILILRNITRMEYKPYSHIKIWNTVGGGIALENTKVKER